MAEPTNAAWAAQLSWRSLKALAERGAVALVPVGSTEAHGPHLPLSVDVVIAEEVCRRIAKRLKTPAVIFPSVAYSLTDFAAPFAGTVSIPAEASKRYLEEILCGIARHGFGRIGVINHHLEPAHFRLVHEAARDASHRSGVGMTVPDHRKRPFSEKLGEEFLHGGSHAGWYETSLMLAAAPALVDEQARRGLPELAVDLPGMIKAGKKDFLECGGPDAYFGNPAAATREDGEWLLDLLAQASADAISAP